MGVDQVSVIASALKHMLAAGMPADAIVAAVEAMEAEIANTPRPRSAGAIRTERYRANGGGNVPGWLRQQIFERDGYACVDCGATERLECDHIIPVSKGGTSEEDNLQTLCRSCNARKRDRIRKRDERGQVRTSSDKAGQSLTIRTLTPSLDKERSPRPPKEINLNPEGDASPCEADPIGFPVSLRLALAIATCQAIQRIKPPFILPADIPAQPWGDFVAMRQRIRKPMTDRAKHLAVIELRKLAVDGWPPGDVLNNSTMNSYQGLVPPKGRNNGQYRQDRAANDICDPMARTVVARQAKRAGQSQDDPF